MFKKSVFVLLVLGLAVVGCSSSDANAALNEVSMAGVAAINNQSGVSDGETLAASMQVNVETAGGTYTIVDTGQTYCYDENGGMVCPSEGKDLFGQDANYQGIAPAYKDNGDGTITDLNTGLTWTQDYYGKMTWNEAMSSADSFSFAGYDDWRLPTIKELYSIIDFNGGGRMTVEQSIPYIDTDYFEFEYGDESAGERLIDAQYWSSTEYIGTTMGGSHTVFGVNFADGRIKGYGTERPNGSMEVTQFVRYVRGNTSYGVNDFTSNGNGTVTDQATGLTWQRSDDGQTRSWGEALSYCEALSLGGEDDWRLPNAKELQSIVDYTQAPTVTGTAAIDSIFDISDIESYFWTSTSHGDSGGRHAIYVAFGRAMGYMNGQWIDVHGAGAQRSDPKVGDPADYPTGHGPQGDDIRIYNYVRCVSGGSATITSGGNAPAGNDQLPPEGGQQQPNGNGQLPSGGNQQPPTGADQQPPSGGQRPPGGGQQPPNGGQLPPGGGAPPNG